MQQQGGNNPHLCPLTKGRHEGSRLPSVFKGESHSGLKLMRLCILRNHYAPVLLLHTGEIMPLAQLLCTRIASEK